MWHPWHRERAGNASLPHRERVTWDIPDFKRKKKRVYLHIYLLPPHCIPLLFATSSPMVGGIPVMAESSTSVQVQGPQSLKSWCKNNSEGENIKGGLPPNTLAFWYKSHYLLFSLDNPMQILTSKGLFSNKTNHSCHCRKTNHLTSFKESFWIHKIVPRTFRMSFYNALF